MRPRGFAGWTRLKIITVIMLCCELACTEVNAADSNAHLNATDKASVLGKITIFGFTKILNIDSDGTGWHVKAKKGTRTYDLHVDSHSGLITSQKRSVSSEIDSFETDEQRNCVIKNDRECKLQNETNGINPCFYTGQVCSP